MATGDETQAGPGPAGPQNGAPGSGDADLTRQVPSLGESLPPVAGGHFGNTAPPANFGPDSLADEFFSNDDPSPDPASVPSRRGGRKPQILAPQANEWATNRQEVEVTKGRRTGLVLLFLLAMVVVALIALGLAALSVLRDGDDNLVTGGTEPTTEEDTTTSDSVPEQTTIPDPNLLQVVVTEEPFICDGARRQFAQLSGAAPNEEIAFSSPQSSGLGSGTADADGVLPVNWQCDPEQAGTTWELTATGATSGKAVTFLFAGALAPETATTLAPTVLTVDLVESPFRCDGGRRVFGELRGAAANEEIALTSPQSPSLSSGTADADGDLTIHWQCTPEQIGTTWEVTATGVTSGRTVTFSFDGAG